MNIREKGLIDIRGEGVNGYQESRGWWISGE